MILADRELQDWRETNVRYSEMAKIVITKVDLKVSLAQKELNTKAENVSSLSGAAPQLLCLLSSWLICVCIVAALHFVQLLNGGLFRNQVLFSFFCFILQEDIAFDAVSVGAILSDYQRVRVENV